MAYIIIAIKQTVTTYMKSCNIPPGFETILEKDLEMDRTENDLDLDLDLDFDNEFIIFYFYISNM
jgi:hypothetical protein